MEVSDIVIALTISILVNFILIAVNDYLLFVILTRFESYMKDEKGDKK